MPRSHSALDTWGQDATRYTDFPRDAVLMRGFERWIEHFSQPVLRPLSLQAGATAGKASLLGPKQAAREAARRQSHVRASTVHCQEPCAPCAVLHVGVVRRRTLT